MLTINLSKQQLLQPIATMALMGSVAAGKSKTVEFLTGETTQKHKAELKNGITIKMGYSAVRIYYNGHDFLTNPKVIPDGYRLVRNLSIADNPGHNSFMATLVTGTSMVGSVIFIVSGPNGLEEQTFQHLKCFKSTGIKNIAFVISKIDLVPTEMKLREVISSVDDLMQKEALDDDIDPPIIPMSSISGMNAKYLHHSIVSNPYPTEINHDKPFIMTIIRSFDINKPGTFLENFEGGVIGGAIQQGYLAKGDIICILPGIISLSVDGLITYTPLITQVLGMRSDITDLDIALPGGFIGIKTTLDPSITRADGLVGNTIIKVKSYESTKSILMQSHGADAFCSVVNHITVKDMVYLSQDKQLIIGKSYMIIIHGASQNAILKSINEDETYTFDLEYPSSTFENEKVAILSNDNSFLEFISYAKYKNGFCDESIKCLEQDDLEDFFADLPIKERVESIEVINDLEQFDEFEELKEKLFDIDHLVKQIPFAKKQFAINCPPIILEKDTTSIIIVNAFEIMSTFTKEPDINMQLSNEFGLFIKQSYGDDLKNASILVDKQRIAFHNVKRANRKFFVQDFNKRLSDFVIQKFTCKTCKVNGSVFYEKKKHYCKSCDAIISIN